MNYYIRQLGECDCGIASLKMLLANVYQNKDFLFYPQKNFNESYTLAELMKIARNEGVDLSAYRVIDKNEIYKLKNKQLLVILDEKSSLHACHVKKINRQSIVLNDPKRGTIKIKMKEFIKLWNGQCL